MVSSRQQEATPARSTPLLQPLPVYATDFAPTGVSRTSDSDQRITLLDAVMYNPRVVLEASMLQQVPSCRETDGDEEERGGTRDQLLEESDFFARTSNRSSLEVPESLFSTQSWQANRVRSFNPLSSHSARDRRNFLLTIIESALQVVDDSEENGELASRNGDPEEGSAVLAEREESRDSMFLSNQRKEEDDRNDFAASSGPAQ